MSLAITKRRIQKLGGSSLIITLPKSWVRKIGLTVGDTVVIVDEGDHLKIMPPDTRIANKLGVFKVKLSGFLKEVDIGKIIDCTYQNGYTRLELQIPSNGTLTPEAIIQQALAHPKVKDAKIIDDYTVFVEIESGNGDNVTTLLKKFNTKLQDIIDAGELAVKGETTITTALSRIESSSDDAYNIVDSITRISFRQGIMMCETKGIDPTILLSLKIIARLLERAVKNLMNFSERELSLKALNLIRIIVSESIGGIASSSGRRIVNSLSKMKELEGVINEMRRLETLEAEKVATCVESLRIALETLSSKGICSIMTNG